MTLQEYVKASGDTTLTTGDPARGGYFTVRDNPFLQFPEIKAVVTLYTAQDELLIQVNCSSEHVRNQEIRVCEGRGATQRELIK